VRDFEPMRARVERMLELARTAAPRYSPEEIEETVAFLAWLLEDNFVFLGYREYEVVDADGVAALAVVEGSGLGILTDGSSSTYAKPVPLESIDPSLRARTGGGDLLIVSKTNRLATVHRRMRMDYIGVKRVAPDGTIAGEARMLGLLTGKAYMEPASRTPLVRRKLEQILELEDMIEGSHDHKTAVQLFESFPKDELLAAPVGDLRRNVMTLMQLQEQQHVRLLTRRDVHGRSVSLLVALPRESFNAALRQRLQDLFMARFNGSSVDYHLALGETDPAQIHFTVHVAGTIPDVSQTELEEEVIALARTWDERLRERLLALHGDQRGRMLAECWVHRFPEYYKASTEVYLAALDIESFDRLETAEEPFVVALQNERAHAESLTRIGFYKQGDKVRLSELMPILEALGLLVVEEVPTRLLDGDEDMHVQDFGVLDADGRPLDLAACGDRVAACIAAVWRGDAESDSLNRLVVTAGLDWRQVHVLRAYRSYRQRVSTGFTDEYRNDAFAAHPAIAAKLVRLFELRFDPAAPDDPGAVALLREAIVADLDAVESLDEDRILRGHLGLIDATVRTNAFRPDRDCLSFKLRSREVPDMPRPRPRVEIFVYSPTVEGIHLRGGRVARGGIRWSDRRQDYRTEVLGLMKAQMTKNAIIVPTGAKGGFVLKRPPAARAELVEEVRRQYSTFIGGLLDLTDNRVAGEVVGPEGVRVLDEPDPYLVVAADKGTAALSDTANALAQERGFWLDDAFASGGATGYDHKQLGITARGAWESVKRHFRELGVDVASDPFTVVGVGDMSGDVFGNGMLLSDRIRLVAAFDHRHVFIDPDPDPAVGIEERRRLFALPHSSWDDYDRATLSPGGGVWPRAAKSIELSAQARAVLGVEAASLTPTEVIRAILRVPVDLLWNGGIGTYVRASSETDADADDRANDAVRVHARELRCRVVGEGGNLGLTQRARIEYARGGGRINADFIDNSAGVDCSDHEVNLKILLGVALERGDLTRKQRDELLAEVAGDVTAHVLADNYNQAQILSQELVASPRRIDAYEDLVQSLEAEGLLDRELEGLPGAEEMAERRRGGQGMVRPELAVLLAYAKSSLAGLLLASKLPDDPYLERDLRGYFPSAVVERFGSLVLEHPLRRELVATVVANDVVNAEGIAFVSWLGAETQARPAAIVRAYRIAREVAGATARWSAIEALDGRIDAALQLDLLAGVDRLVQGLTRAYLTYAPGADVGGAIAAAQAPFAALAEAIPQIASPERQAARAGGVAALLERGVPEDVARRHVGQAELVHAPAIIAVARAHERDVVEVAHGYFAISEALELGALEARLEGVAASSRWQVLALQAIEDDLLLARRQLVERVLAEGAERPVEEAAGAYLVARAEPREHFVGVVRALAHEDVSDLAPLTVAVRLLRALLD